MNSFSPDMIEQLRDMIREALEPLGGRVQRSEEKLRRLDIQINGQDGEFGVAQQVRVLWRSHVWILCTMSAAAGSGLTGLITYLFK